MELTHLRYFIAVAEELHFGRAAEKLHISQPPLSQQIKRLEDELEVKLFNRTSRRVELTTAGKIFLAEALSIIERADNARAEIVNFGKGKSGYLSIAFNSVAISSFLPEVIKNFMREYPEVRLSLRESVINEQFKALDEKRIDLAFMRPFGYDIDIYSKRLVVSEPYMLALPQNHKLLKHEVITTKMLDGQPLIMFPRSSFPYLCDYFDQIFENAGVKVNIIQELNSKLSTLSLVKAGVGLAFVPESSFFYCPKGVEYRKLEGDFPLVETFALWRKDNNSPALKNLLKMVPSV